MRRIFRTSPKKITGVAKGLTLYASSNDRAMMVSRSVHRDIPRAGDVQLSGPVIVPGIDSVDVSAVSTALFSTNHSTYAESKELLSDISALMLEGKHPPSFRNGKFKAQGEEQRVYWRYTE